VTRPAWRASGCALAEVALAFAVMHVAFRAFKRFTEWGQTETANAMNFSPGIAMILVAVVFMALGRRRPMAYGLTARPFLPGVPRSSACSSWPRAGASRSPAAPRSSAPRRAPPARSGPWA